MWGSPATGVWVGTATGYEPMKVLTATSTALLESGRGRWLRMFGDIEGALYANYFDPAGRALLATPDDVAGLVGGAASVGRWLSRLDSVPSPGSPPFAFKTELDSTTGCPTRFDRTAVPLSRSGFSSVTWMHDVIDGYGPGYPHGAPAWEYQASDYPLAELSLAHPQVVAVPDRFGGGWLLVAERTARFSGSSSSGGLNVTRDVVAYYAADPSFRDDLHGPYLLVHSLAAVPYQDGSHPACPWTFRTWTNVPGAAFAEEGGIPYLLVYYLVEDGVHGGPNDTDIFWEDQGPGAAQYQAVQAYESAFGAGASRGVHVTRFRPHGSLLSWLEAATSRPESRWRRTDVPSRGEALGRVRFFQRSGVGSLVTRLDPDLADPAPCWCDRAGVLSLYVKATRAASAIWRGAAIGSGVSLREQGSCVPVTTDFGRDFLWRGADDTVVEGDPRSGSTEPMDPDPVVVPSGETLVFYSDGRASDPELKKVHGAGCVSWRASSARGRQASFDRGGDARTGPPSLRPRSWVERATARGISLVRPPSQAISALRAARTALPSARRPVGSADPAGEEDSR
jgi:hypothetical protein